VFAERGGVYAEPSGLWVIGGKTAILTVQPRGQRALAVRNGPAANVVRISYGGGQEQYRLAPGELKSVRLAPSRERDGVPVTISSKAGFRPGDLEAGNLDVRYLGLWVELR
jgi:hypothetical protein